jgi:hypothetical protein
MLHMSNYYPIISVVTESHTLIKTQKLKLSNQIQPIKQTNIRLK